MILYFRFEQPDWSCGYAEDTKRNDLERQSTVEIQKLQVEFVKFQMSVQMNTLSRQLAEGPGTEIFFKDKEMN